jgi:gliding motility-associated-like protein
MSAYGQYSSYDCDFWLGFPKQIEFNPLLEITLSAQGDANATIELPGLGFDSTLFVPGGGTTTLELPVSAGVITTSEVIDPRGIHVTSDAPISVHMRDSYQYTSDGSIVWPTDLLGSYYTVHAWQSFVRPGYFLIVATEDNTSVNITPSANTTGGAPAGVSFNININQGDAYMVTSTGDLTGSTVDADKPIAVFGGNECANVPDICSACDFLIEQQLPDDKLGTEYVAALTPTRFEDVIQILAINNGTDVYLNGALIATLNAGQSVWSQVYDAVHIEGSQPISVGQFCVGTSCDGVVDADPMMILLMPTGQLPGGVRFSTINSANLTSHWVSIMVETVGINDVFVNGVNVPAAFFTAVPAAPDWSYAYVPLSSGSHIVESAYSFTAYASGFGNYDSYGYIAGLPTDLPTGEITYFQGCEIQGVELTSGSADDDHIWSTGETTDTIVAIDTGIYWVDVFYQSGCSYRDSFYISLLDAPDVSIPTPDPFCPDSGESVYLEIDTTGLPVVEWSNGVTGEPGSIYSQVGEAWVYVENADGCFDTVFVTLEEFCEEEDPVEPEPEEDPYVFEVPNAFSPNGDGVNDLFRPFFGNAGLDRFRLQIFNRWGEVVYYSEDQNAGWDGTFQGKEQEMGTYIFVLGYRVVDPAPREAEEVRGSVTLIR